MEQDPGALAEVFQNATSRPLCVLSTVCAVHCGWWILLLVPSSHSGSFSSSLVVTKAGVFGPEPLSKELKEEKKKTHPDLV